MIASSQFVEISGLRLHYLDYGSPEKPPLVCLHGLSGNAHNFDYLAPQLAPDWHVMALDVRGRGDSAWGPPGDYNQQVYMADLAGMLDALALPRVTLIGTSMGGVIAMMFAGGYPERVERLVLNDVGPEIDPAGLGRITSYMTSSPSSFATMADVTQYYRENYPPLKHIPEPALVEFVRWSVRPGPENRLVWKLDPAVRNIPRSGTAARAMDLWMPYARIAAPILVVRGAISDILSRGTAERMRVVQRRTTVVEVPGVGHAPSLSEPAALAAIKEFLAL
ncbi:MAG: alpha/beta fold hydrolase [Candidatus Binataceae bacterium]